MKCLFHCQYNRESETAVQLEGETEQLITDEKMNTFHSQFGGGIFEGICEFCNKNIKPFPTVEQQKTKQPDQLYCCEDYR